jgi:hypothetical protein
MVESDPIGLAASAQRDKAAFAAIAGGNAKALFDV